MTYRPALVRSLIVQLAREIGATECPPPMGGPDYPERPLNVYDYDHVILAAVLDHLRTKTRRVRNDALLPNYDPARILVRYRNDDLAASLNEMMDRLAKQRSERLKQIHEAYEAGVIDERQAVDYWNVLPVFFARVDERELIEQAHIWGDWVEVERDLTTHTVKLRPPDRPQLP